MADMTQVRNDVQHVGFSLTGKANTVHVADLHLEQNQREPMQEND